MMKNMKWKKYAGAAMAAAMIPALVAPIATEASGAVSTVGKIGLSIGHNFDMKLDGKGANHLLRQKVIGFVNTKNPDEIYIKNAGQDMVRVAPNKTYDIYDLTDVGTGPDAYKDLERKGQITAYTKNSTHAVLNYSTVQETKVVKAADFDLMSDSYAYDEVEGRPVFNSFTGVKKNMPNAELIINGQKTKFVNNISAHAPASIKFNLKDKNVTKFVGQIGLDANRKSGTIKIDVLIDGVEVDGPYYQTPYANSWFLNEDIPAGTETLEIRVTGVGATDNPNENAMFILGDGLFVQQVETIK